MLLEGTSAYRRSVLRCGAAVAVDCSGASKNSASKMSAQEAERRQAALRRDCGGEALTVVVHKGLDAPLDRCWDGFRTVASSDLVQQVFSGAPKLVTNEFVAPRGGSEDDFDEDEEEEEEVEESQEGDRRVGHTSRLAATTTATAAVAGGASGKKRRQRKDVDEKRREDEEEEEEEPSLYPARKRPRRGGAAGAAGGGSGPKKTKRHVQFETASPKHKQNSRKHRRQADGDVANGHIDEGNNVMHYNDGEDEVEEGDALYSPRKKRRHLSASTNDITAGTNAPNSFTPTTGSFSPQAAAAAAASAATVAKVAAQRRRPAGSVDNRVYGTREELPLRQRQHMLALLRAEAEARRAAKQRGTDETKRGKSGGRGRKASGGSKCSTSSGHVGGLRPGRRFRKGSVRRAVQERSTELVFEPFRFPDGMFEAEKELERQRAEDERLARKTFIAVGDPATAKRASKMADLLPPPAKKAPAKKRAPAKKQPTAKAGVVKKPRVRKM